MLRYPKLTILTGLGAILWAVGSLGLPSHHSWFHGMSGVPGPVRILRFEASVGTLTAGQRARLCYGVENARSVRISPMLQGVYPSMSHCLEIVPEHTTHYTLLAEGFDGNVATRSLTLPVETAPYPRRQLLHYARLTRPATVGF